MQSINKEDGKYDDRDDQEIPGYDGLDVNSPMNGR